MTGVDALSAIVVGAPALPLLVTVANVAGWRRPRAPADSLGRRVSALVPARNEAAVIEACVRALLAEPVFEVLVYDDGSTDETPHILERLRAEDSRLRVLRGGTLPAGWVGKPHACHQLSESARGDVLLFVDADTRLLPGAVSAIDAVDADVVTAFPAQEIRGVGEGLVVPLLHLTYTSWLYLPLVRRVRDPRVLAANGQVLRITRDAYDAIGGFAAVRDAIVDDMSLCRNAKQRGRTVAFVPGEHLATCRMYTSFAEAWRGFSKNLYPGLGSAPLAAFVGALYVAAFVLPWVVWPAVPAAAVAGAALNLVQRALLAVRFRLPWWTVPLHLPSVLVFLAILANSARWTAAGTLRWRGRTYAGAGGAR